MKQRNNIPKPILIVLVALIFVFLFLTFAKNSSLVWQDKDEDATLSGNHTTAPVISCDIKTKTIVAGETITIDQLGIKVTDASSIESLAFTKITSDYFYTGSSNEDNEKIKEMKKAYKDGISFFGTEVQFSYGGIYTLTVTATDRYQNKSDFDFTLKVETPPVIEAKSDFYIAVGSEIDFSKYISAWDLLDEDFSFEDIEINTDSLNKGKTGNYVIAFSGTDNYGLSATYSYNVYVRSKEDLQELINTQKINVTDHIIIGAPNPYDIGYYEDSSALEEALIPSLVAIKNPKSDVLENGFIIKIDEEFVTMATNESVTSDSLTVDVTFYNDTTCSASVVFTNTEYDLAFIRLPIDGANEMSSVSSDFASTLRTVHLDETQWKKHEVLSQVSLKQLLRHYELVFKKKLQYE